MKNRGIKEGTQVEINVKGDDMEKLNNLNIYNWYFGKETRAGLASVCRFNERIDKVYMSIPFRDIEFYNEPDTYDDHYHACWERDNFGDN
jgi:hypothetical protein